jgi:hypothetical protein
MIFDVPKNHFDSKLMRMNWFNIENRVINPAEFNASVAFAI